MVERLLAFIQDQKLFTPDDKLLLAISGGIDSMVLLDLFKSLDFEFAIAHCNFSLRGVQSDEDEHFVRSYAESHAIPHFFKCFDTKKYANDSGVSTQMAARELRYTWFEELSRTHHYNYVVTAHHLNDSLETCLFNLAKGTGIAGLRGMLVSNNNVARPLLFLRRDEIEKYALDNDLKWREDSSNASIKYHRNLIRHKVIPELKQINPLVEKTFVNTSRRIIETEEAIRFLVEDLRRQYVKVDGADVWIEKKALINAMITYELVREYGFNYQRAIDIHSNLNSRTGGIFMSDEYQINNDREHLIVSPLEAEWQGTQIDENMSKVSIPNFALSFETLDYDHASTLMGRNASFDFSRLKFPLKIRKWKEGDKLIPLGMTGKKKVSDFMIDAKIPLNLKSRVYVLLSGEEIIWIVGYRIDDRYKITAQTKLMYNITIEDHD